MSQLVQLVQLVKKQKIAMFRRKRSMEMILTPSNEGSAKNSRNQLAQASATTVTSDTSLTDTQHVLVVVHHVRKFMFPASLQVYQRGIWALQ